ncbi:MAG: tryptophan--tRNA ligase [Clostridiales bacterium]|nr:tryptophan--tRNA ligase [Clostridiales bacterium]MCF8021243.1 tryptophan--tRNA ligase [Clostridiales bacterium]
MSKGRILSGMRPTGKLHIGHKSVLDNWKELQKEYECFFCSADLHALTTSFDNPGGIRTNTREMIADWLAAGIDPEKSVIFVQSDVHQHAELHLLLSMITPLGWLERVPSYKEKIQYHHEEGKDIMNYGFLGYPVLMTADILVYRADTVPVGEDQLPHLELSREIARRYNHLYSTVFPEPQAKLAEVPLLPGIDGRKMSKSYNNDISISADTEEIAAKVNAMVTDPNRIRKTDPGNPEVCVVYKYHSIFTAEELEAIAEDCRQGNIGCVACKKYLAQRLNNVIKPIRERRAEIMNKPGYVDEVLYEGSRKASEIAQKTIEMAKNALFNE